MNLNEIEYQLKDLKSRVSRLESSGPSLATLFLFVTLLFLMFPDLFGGTGEQIRQNIKEWILK